MSDTKIKIQADLSEMSRDFESFTEDAAKKFNDTFGKDATGGGHVVDHQLFLVFGQGAPFVLLPDARCQRLAGLGV